MYARQALRQIPLLLLFILLLLAGCSETTDPTLDKSGDGGQIDPGAGSFVLKYLDLTHPDGRYVRLELVGSNLVLDDDGTHVELTVAVRNATNMSLAGPITLWLSSFDPASVFVANPDTNLPVASILPVGGFIYGAEFGSDYSLAPGEISAGKLWRFTTPDQGSFSFGIRADLGRDTRSPVIAGDCFWDPNRNGTRDSDESPLVPGEVHIIAPDSTVTVVPVDNGGRYRYLLPEVGLYRVHFVPLFWTFAPLAYSAPNPREVLITPSADGVPQGIHNVDFGAYTDLSQGPPTIQFTNAPLDSLHHELWSLIEADISSAGHLVCEVGYSGCQPRHRFSLWSDGAFMESMPVQVNIVLVHKTEEACDAYWEGVYTFNIHALRERFLAGYGPGVLLLNLIDFEGSTHQIEWEIE